MSTHARAKRGVKKNKNKGKESRDKQSEIDISRIIIHDIEKQITESIDKSSREMNSIVIKLKQKEIFKKFQIKRIKDTMTDPLQITLKQLSQKYRINYAVFMNLKKYTILYQNIVINKLKCISFLIFDDHYIIFENGNEITSGDTKSYSQIMLKSFAESTIVSHNFVKIINTFKQHIIKTYNNQNLDNFVKYLSISDHSTSRPQIHPQSITLIEKYCKQHSGSTIPKCIAELIIFFISPSKLEFVSNANMSVRTGENTIVFETGILRNHKNEIYLMSKYGISYGNYVLFELKFKNMNMDIIHKNIHFGLLENYNGKKVSQRMGGDGCHKFKCKKQYDDNYHLPYFDRRRQVRHKEMDVDLYSYQAMNLFIDLTNEKQGIIEGYCAGTGSRWREGKNLCLKRNRFKIKENKKYHPFIAFTPFGGYKIEDIEIKCCIEYLS